MPDHNKRIGYLFFAFAVFSIYIMFFHNFWNYWNWSSKLRFDDINFYKRIALIILDFICGFLFLTKNKIRTAISLPIVILKIKFIPLGLLFSFYYFWHLNNELNEKNFKYNFLKYFYNNKLAKVFVSLFFRITYLYSIIPMFVMYGVGLAMGFDSGFSSLMLTIAILYIVLGFLAISVAFIPANKLLNLNALLFFPLLCCAVHYHFTFRSLLVNKVWFLLS